jgi:hypothetical protein
MLHEFGYSYGSFTSHVLASSVKHPVYATTPAWRTKVRTSTTNRQALEVAHKVFRVAERHRLRRVDFEELLHVEDLDAMTLSLAPNDHQIILTWSQSVHNSKVRVR